MKKIYLIMNPTAKSGRGKKKWDQIFSYLNEFKLDFKVGESQYAGHSIELAYQAAKSTCFDVVVAVGGDGTINEVLNGILKASAEVNTIPALGILYTGTSPDICKFHKIPLEMKRAVEILENSDGELIDIGQVEYIKDKRSVTSHFLCSVNLGIGARVADGSNSGLRKYLGDFLGTFISIIIAVLKYKRSDMHCLVDGKQEIYPAALNMTIGKNPYIASGTKVNVSSTPNCGKMYLFSINRMGLFGVLRNIKYVYNGDFYKHKNNTLKYIESFECLYNENAPEVEFDGDPQGHLPCKIKLLPKVIRIIK